MHRVDGPFEDQLHSAIRSNPHLIGQQFSLEATQGRVVLRGVVPSFFQKQMAQEALRKVAGVEEIENHLEVCWG